MLSRTWIVALSLGAALVAAPLADSAFAKSRLASHKFTPVASARAAAGHARAGTITHKTSPARTHVAAAHKKSVAPAHKKLASRTHKPAAGHTVPVHHAPIHRA